MNEIILDYYHNNSEFASLDNSSLLKSKKYIKSW